VIALLRIWRLAGVEPQEMMHLPEHRPDPAHLEHQPLERRDPGRRRLLRPQPAGLLGEIDEDGAALEDALARVAIDDRRDLVVRADRQEGGAELLVLADIDRVNLVGETTFLEHDRDLAAVRRAPGVEIDHPAAPARWRARRGSEG
jgi:hypothetical protein